jgi:hypothetical protein
MKAKEIFQAMIMIVAWNAVAAATAHVYSRTSAVKP